MKTMIRRLLLLLAGLAANGAAQNNGTHPLGLLRPTEPRYAGYPVIGIPPAGLLPSQATLEAFAPPPGDQGLTQGSCTAWATTYAVRTAMEAQTNNAWRPLDVPLHQFSPAFVFNMVKAAMPGPVNCTAGIYFDDALDLLRQTGAVTFDQFIYDPNSCGTKATTPQITAARSYRIASWFRLDNLNTATIKTHIANGYPVLAGIDVHNSFDQSSGTDPIRDSTGPSRGYHAIALIGYDDARNAFRLQNSWGPGWGDHGRAWIDYDALAAVIHEALRVVPLLPPSALELTLNRPRFGVINEAGADRFTAMNRLAEMMFANGNRTEAKPEDRYAVVVNAFASKDQALQAARSIAQGPSGLDAKVQSRTVNGKAEFSVLVGAGLDSVESTIVKEKALRLGYPHAAAVPMK